ncbi:IS1 family transposase, partial [Shigella sonnei]|uniref:IS1 family transposase n=1 Tax=Shigella sonnei TaxID=624 RepID=UPI0009461818
PYAYFAVWRQSDMCIRDGMTDGWPLYESRLKGKLHVISKRYTQRIERHNLNLRQHLARLGRKSLSFSKSVELHDKVIGHYLNIKHYQ